MIHSRALALTVVLALAGACGGPPAPEPDSTAVVEPPQTQPFDTVRVTRPGPDAPPVTILDSAGASDDSVWFAFRDGRLPGIEVMYSSTPVVECGSGEPVSTTGNAALLVRMTPTDAHEFDGERALATITERRRTLNGTRVLRMDMICDFEAQVEWVISLAQPVGFRLRPADNGGRFVIELERQ